MKNNSLAVYEFQVISSTDSADSQSYNFRLIGVKITHTHPCDNTNTVMPCLAKQIACVAEHVGWVHWEMSLGGDGVFAMPGGKQMALLCVHRHGWTNSSYGKNTSRRWETDSQTHAQVHYTQMHLHPCTLYPSLYSCFSLCDNTPCVFFFCLHWSYIKRELCKFVFFFFLQFWLLFCLYRAPPILSECFTVIKTQSYCNPAPVMCICFQRSQWQGNQWSDVYLYTWLLIAFVS